MALGLIIALAVFVGLLALLLVVPWRVELSAEARAEPDGSWAAAGGVSCGPLALSGVGARGVTPTVHVYVFGRRKYSHALAEPADETAQDAPDESLPADEGAAEPQRRRGRLRRFLSRRVDPIDAVAWVFAERHRVRLELDLTLSYSFHDVALTGKMLGGLYVLSPLLPRGVRLRQTPSWESVDRGELQASGNVRVFAGLVLCDFIWYMLRSRRLLRRKQPEPAGAERGT